MMEKEGKDEIGSASIHGKSTSESLGDAVVVAGGLRAFTLAGD